MNKSYWIIASVSMVLAFGLGDAGCHTSGIPGGMGAGGFSGTGGVTNMGGQSSSGAGAGQQNDASVQSDAGEGASCDNDFDCSATQICDNKICVDCLSDNDCLSTGKGKVCQNKICLACASDRGCDTGQRCYRSKCIASLACSSSDRTTCVRETPRMTCGPNGYCVECIDDGDCEQYAPSICLPKVCTCDSEGGVCLNGNERVNQQSDSP